jgi:serine/threonine protein kinase
VAGELRPEDPAQVGPYRLVTVLGDGRMGRGYLGQSANGRRVAVKVIRPDLADDHAFRRRFRREVNAACKVRGRHTTLVVRADAYGKVPWLATAYVDGPSLSAELARTGPFGPRRLLDLAAGLAEGLAAIHEAGLVHRDLKPSNVLLGPDGPVIADYGISGAVEASTLTVAGTLIGWPGFMAPEQITDGASVSPASDVFSLGALLCLAATGRRPFGTGPLEGIVNRTVHAEPDLTGVPGALAPLVARCLAKDPAQRPSTARILEEVLALGTGGELVMAPDAEPATVTAQPAGSPPTAPWIPAPSTSAPMASAASSPIAASGRRVSRRAPWLLAVAALVTVVAVVPLLSRTLGLASGPGPSVAGSPAVRSPAVSSPAVGSPRVSSPAPTAPATGPQPPITQAQAQQVLSAYTTTNNAANAAASQPQIATVEGGSSLAIDAGIYRKQRAMGSRGYPPYTAITASFLIPREPAAYPHWFAVRVKNAFISGPAKQTSLEYLVFTQAAPGAPWLDVLEPYILTSTAGPGIALDATGYATAVPTSDASLAVPPADVGAVTAAAFDSGTSLPGPGNLADALDLRSLHASLLTGTSLQDQHAAAGPFFGLRLTDGGALVFYEVTARLTVTAPARRTVALNVPGFFSPAIQFTHAVIDYQEQFAVVDPARGKGTLGPVVADYSGITGQG